MLGLVEPYTMTVPASIKILMDSVTHIIKNNISGDFVECGVWKGGSVMVILKMLIQLDVWDRHVYLYDTFEGMTPPTKEDIETKSNKLAIEEYKRKQKHNKSNWVNIPLDEVKTNVGSIGYPSKLIHYIKGNVQDTLPVNAPEKIALLRLDTDWYQSTKHELETLYPRLSKKGIIILDDYGGWKGVKQAVDEYFKGNQIFLVRVEDSTRIGMKLQNTTVKDD